MNNLSRLKNKTLKFEITNDTQTIISEKNRCLKNRLEEFDTKNLYPTTPENYWNDFVHRCSKKVFFRKVIKDKKDLLLILYCATVLPEDLVVKNIKSGLNIIINEAVLLFDKKLLYKLYTLYLCHYKEIIADEILLNNLKLLFEKFKLGYPFREETIKHISGIISKEPAMYLKIIYEKSTKGVLDFLIDVLGSKSIVFETEFGITTLINFSDQISITKYKYLIEEYFNNTSLTLYKILFSQIIMKLDKVPLTFDEKNYLLNKSISYIGSPRNTELWNSIYLYKDYSRLGINCSIILKKWSREKLAVQFFESMAFDKTRKSFWLKYIDKLDDLKIAITKSDLSLHPQLLEITKQLPEMFIKAETGTSAILMKYKDNLIVEFSKQGNALYFYHKNTEEFSYFYKGNIYYTEGLKNTSIGSYNNYRKTGKVSHIQGWTRNTEKIMREL